VLASGDYRRGLALYEHRFAEIARTQVWELGIPEWQGEELAGKQILIHHDQGMGDDLQFARFLPDLRERDANITLAVPSDLMPLMQRPRAVAGAPSTSKETTGGRFPLADRLLLLRHLDIDLPALWQRPYLECGLRWDDRPLLKPPGTKLAIGLVWASRPLGEVSARRSPLGMLLELAAIPGVALYGLQVGAAARDLDAGPGVLIQDLSRQMRDWRDTAAYMAVLDLIVSVDSAPLHLAGALGRPCFALLPFVPCWRWGFHTDQTPWYPNMRLLRQAAPGDWSNVISNCGIRSKRLPALLFPLSHQGSLMPYSGPLDLVSGAVFAYRHRALSSAWLGNDIYTTQRDRTAARRPLPLPAMGRPASRRRRRSAALLAWATASRSCGTIRAATGSSSARP